MVGEGVEVGSEEPRGGKKGRVRRVDGGVGRQGDAGEMVERGGVRSVPSLVELLWYF